MWRWCLRFWLRLGMLPPVVCTMSGADGQVVLRAAVGAEDVIQVLYFQFFQRHTSRYGDLEVEAVTPAV